MWGHQAVQQQHLTAGNLPKSLQSYVPLQVCGLHLSASAPSGLHFNSSLLLTHLSQWLSCISVMSQSYSASWESDNSYCYQQNLAQASALLPCCQGTNPALQFLQTERSQLKPQMQNTKSFQVRAGCYRESLPWTEEWIPAGFNQEEKGGMF